MQLEQLKFFSEIVKCGSINKASQNLFLSPSTLSNSLSNLEKELGFKLVDRSNQGITPTELGKEIANQANSILRMLDDYYTNWQNLNSTNYKIQSTVSIGLSPLSNGTPLIKALLQLKNSYPYLDCQINEMPTKDIIRLLDEKVLDFGIISRFLTANYQNKSHYVLDNFLKLKKNWKLYELTTCSLAISLSANTDTAMIMEKLSNSGPFELEELFSYTLFYPDKETHIFDQFSEKLPFFNCIPMNSSSLISKALLSTSSADCLAFCLDINPYRTPIISLQNTTPGILQELLVPNYTSNSAYDIILRHILDAYN